MSLLVANVGGLQACRVPGWQHDDDGHGSGGRRGEARQAGAEAQGSSPVQSSPASHGPDCRPHMAALPRLSYCVV